jgi:hypothetical protein
MLTIIHRLVVAALVGIAGTLCLLAVNVAVMGTGPDHFRGVVEEAVASGGLARVQQLPLGPPRQFYPHGGEDCLILTALTMPRESRLRASISPRIPDAERMPAHIRAEGTPGYPPTPPCRVLAWVMQTSNDAAVHPVPAPYNHRYLHGALTIAAMLLTVLSFDTVSRLLLWSCFGMLAALALGALGALVRTRAKTAGERRRAAAFLVIAVVLAACYGLPFYARSFPYAPTDIVIFAFLLFGLLQPLCRLSERHFVLAVATFGIATGSLELLTGGIPMALGVVITLVALGAPPDAPTAIRRLILGILCFGAAIAAGFAAKLIVVWAIWGPAEIGSFMSILGNRMLAPISDRVPPALADWLGQRGVDTAVFDHNISARFLLAAVMVT